MNDFKQLLDAFPHQTGLVVGDVMLDKYIFGEATRISPEAPVMVVRQNRSHQVPGGAANVAYNVRSMGAKVHLVGVIGTDPAGDQLVTSLGQIGMGSNGLARVPHRPTTTKTRIIANHSHQVLRIDHEDDQPLAQSEADAIKSKIHGLMEGITFVLLSDYAKGCLSEEVVRAAVRLAHDRKIPVIANPKPGTALRYKGCDLISLNRSEAAALIGAKTIVTSDATVAAKQIQTLLGAKAIVITLGGDGLAAAYGDEVAQQSAVKVEVYDEAGAGDTTIATLALTMAAGQFGKSALALACRMAAVVVSKVGVVVPNLTDLEQIRAETGTF